MKSYAPAAFATSILLALIAIGPAVVSAEESCTDCESTRWEASEKETVLDGEYGLHGETPICLVAEILALLEALERAKDLCIEAAGGEEPCSSKSNSCPPGKHCALGYSYGELHTSPMVGELPYSPPEGFQGCSAEQEIHCFCHCVPNPAPDPRYITKTAPPTSPTPSKSPTPQSSRVA